MKTNNVVKKIKCVWVSNEICKERVFTKCSNIKTGSLCFKRRCCKLIVKGKEKRKVQCKFVDSEVCSELIYSQCFKVQKGSNCSREKCCKMGKVGGNVRKISCEWKGKNKM